MFPFDADVWSNNNTSTMTVSKKKNHLSDATLVKDDAGAGGHCPLPGSWTHQAEAHNLGNNGDGV